MGIATHSCLASSLLVSLFFDTLAEINSLCQQLNIISTNIIYITKTNSLTAIQINIITPTK